MRFTLANLEDSYDCTVVIRPHPQYKNYDEQADIHKLLTDANSKRVYPYKIIDGNDHLLEALIESSVSWDDIEIITSDGSVVLELGQLGSKIVCTQQSYGILVLIICHPPYRPIENS